MLRTLLLSAVLGLLVTLTALADDTPPADHKTEKPATVELYRVKNADLGEVQQAFAALVGRTPTRLGKAGTGRGGVGGPGGANTPGGGKGGGFGRTTPADEPFIDPGTGGAAPVTARGIADPRTRSLIVRGTEKDQQLAADLVAVLDTPEGKPLPPLKVLKAFRLQNIDATDLTNILQTLDPRMTYRLAPVGTKLLLATGNEEQMKELADSVKKLDIPPDTK